MEITTFLQLITVVYYSKSHMLSRYTDGIMFGIDNYISSKSIYLHTVLQCVVILLIRLHFTKKDNKFATLKIKNVHNFILQYF